MKHKAAIMIIISMVIISVMGCGNNAQEMNKNNPSAKRFPTGIPKYCNFNII